jgi:flagellar motor switch protein FliG
MDKIRNAAIILLGVGEKSAADIMKTMNPREVRAIIEAINNLDNITEEDVISVMNEFFTESNNSSGLDFNVKEQIKNSLMVALGGKGGAPFMHGVNSDKDHWLDLVKEQPMDSIVDMIQDEHPQVITAIVIVVFNNISSDNGTRLIKAMPKQMQNEVFKRIICIDYVSQFALDTLGKFFQIELETEKNNIIVVDGLDTVANIISYLDSDTEKQIMTELTKNWVKKFKIEFSLFIGWQKLIKKVCKL